EVCGAVIVQLTQLKPGDPAPLFGLPDQNGRPVRLEDYRGRKLLVYFYPKADTSGCTAQSCSVRDHLGNLDTLGAAAVGISPDLPKAQAKFDAKYGLGFPLRCGPDQAAAAALRVRAATARARQPHLA